MPDSSYYRYSSGESYRDSLGVLHYIPAPDLPASDTIPSFFSRLSRGRTRYILIRNGFIEDLVV